MRKKPCSECRRWFRPDPRVGWRQKTCGDPVCVKARHRRMDRAWHSRHPDYDRSRRWQMKLDLAEEAGEKQPSSNHRLKGVPWDMVESELGVRPAVIVVEIAALATRRAQDKIETQGFVLKEEFRRLAQQSEKSAQEEMALQAHEIEEESRRHAQEATQEEIGSERGPP